MHSSLLLFLAVLFLAFWNGANDVSKSVATLAGSGVSRLRSAVVWGSIWTAAGGVAAAFAATGLVQAFSGNGLIPAMPDGHALPIAVAGGALLWVAFATRTALPVSTTHAITGALLGAGIAAVGWNGIAWPVLAANYAAPLLLSPLVSITLVFLAMPLTRVTFGGLQRHCVCVERECREEVWGGGTLAADPATGVSPLQSATVAAMTAVASTTIVTGTAHDCKASPAVVARLNLMDGMHWLTAGATSFARGLNDAPKILGLGIAASATLGLSPTLAFILVAAAMVAGSLIAGLRVTETLACKVTTMAPAEGFAANLVSAAVVILASRLALPVSTTHVSSGAIIGLGLKRGRRNIHWKTVREMIGAWVITVPVTATVAAILFLLIRGVAE